jgi:hypothetical protein
LEKGKAWGFFEQTWGQTLSRPLREIQEIEPLREGREDGGFVVVFAADPSF